MDDEGYAALFGAFGPALIDVTGSRPAARQADGMAGAARIRHPRELRAIPNNAILQQLGWCANTLQGLGAAAARHPETFADMRQNSRRFHRAMDLATHALAHSDIDVLRAVIATLDPGTWLDRAAQTATRGGREALIACGARAGTAGHLGGGAVDVPSRACRPSGAARDLAGRAAHGDARGAAARAAAGADPPHLAAVHRDRRFLAAPRRDTAGAGGAPSCGWRSSRRSRCWRRSSLLPPTGPRSSTMPSRRAPRGTTAYAREHGRSSHRCARCSAWCARSPPS